MILYAMLLVSAYAGYTPQDNGADFGPISPLATILANVILVDLYIYRSVYLFIFLLRVCRVSEANFKTR